MYMLTFPAFTPLKKPQQTYEIALGGIIVFISVV